MYLKSVFGSVLFVLFFITGCAQHQPGQTISLDEVLSRIEKNDTSFVVIDVRTEPELYGPLGKLENTIHIPLQDLSSRISEIEKYKEKEIAVICRTDNRSAVARDFLKQAGYNVKNVPGGMVLYQSKKN